MSEPVQLRGSSRPGALSAARLLRAVGEGADAVLSRLTPQEAAAITVHMESPSTDNHLTEQAALEAFLRQSQPQAEQRHMGAEPSRTGIWSRLEPRHAALLAALIHRESPQVAAWIMTRLEPGLAASVVRMLDEATGVAMLRRVVDLQPLPAGVASLIEASLEATLDRLSEVRDVDGHVRIARIVDQLGADREQSLLAGLEARDPAAAERVRSLRFTFEDLAQLNAAGMQTLLSRIDRSELTLALKGAPVSVANVFFSNMTRRAGALVRDEMAALGAVRRSEIDAARGSILETARALLRSGDIRGPGQSREDDELVE